MIFEKQDYQQECIENIITLLENFNFKHQSAENLKDCFAKFHTQIPIKALSNKLNIDILMETGTGKTFTYLNLIFELHKIYKQNKFIIFVPRKAILESVRQNIRLTKDYFYNQYKHHLKIYTYEGSKSQSAIINHYIKNTDELSVLILTNSARGKKDNILNKSNESLFDTKSIFENIAALNPISIIDEPHLLKGEAFNAYFSKVKTLYFRFGATFPQDNDFKLSNVAYCLDSISAFRKYLVKQIRVHTISKDSQAPFLLVSDSKSAKLSFLKAGVEKCETFYKGADLGRLDSSLSGVNIVKTTKDKAYLSNGEILEKLKSYKLQDSEITTLLKKAIDLHFEKEAILFAQNIKALSLFFIPNIEDFREVEGKGAPFIKNEFERLYKQKRKEILSNPHLPQNYKDYLAKDFDESGNLRVHQGYFSGDSQGIAKKKNTKENIEANDIKMILEQKEKLLSFDTPLRFIFSVWALQEGWDNPNIFTLTKLAHSSSDTSRHQQVGRGLRICVNSEGKRITNRYLNSNDNAFFDINYLDMLISGEELGFIEGLQNEIMESSFVFGGDFIDGNVLNEMIKHKEKSDDFIYLLRRRLKVIEYNEENNTYKIISPIYEAIKDNVEVKEILGDDFAWVLEQFKEPENKHKQVENANIPQEKVKIRKELAKDFKELWHAINAKVQLTYHNIHKQTLINSITKAFNQTKIEKESITYECKIYDATQNKIIVADSATLKDKNYKKALQKELSTLLLDFAKDSYLPLKLIYEIYNALNHENFYNSPKKAFATFKNIITDSLHTNLLSCVSYEFCQNVFSNTAFTFSENDPLYTREGEPKEEIYKHKLGRYESKDKEPSDKYLYDKAIWDSKIEEEVILENVENIEHKSIEVFAKLPKFSIPTPFKAYQPDFAYLLKDKKGQKIFFVCETKGYDKESDIPAEEQYKIDYAKRFFESLQSNLKNTKVIFTTRINKQSLLDTIKSTLKDKV